MVTLASLRVPARLTLPRLSQLANISKALHPLLAARARARWGGSDLAWLWVQPHAIQSLDVVELIASCEPRFGHLTYLWMCVCFYISLNVPRRPLNRCQVRSKQL